MPEILTIEYRVGSEARTKEVVPRQDLSRTLGTIRDKARSGEFVKFGLPRGGSFYIDPTSIVSVEHPDGE